MKTGKQQIKKVKVVFATPAAKKKIEGGGEYIFEVNTLENFEHNFNGIYLPELVRLLQLPKVEEEDVKQPFQLYVGGVTLFFWVYIELKDGWNDIRLVQSTMELYMEMIQAAFEDDFKMHQVLMNAKQQEPYSTFEGSYEQDYTVTFY